MGDEIVSLTLHRTSRGEDSSRGNCINKGKGLMLFFSLMVTNFREESSLLQLKHLE
jgi:hypothetical protein